VKRIKRHKRRSNSKVIINQERFKILTYYKEHSKEDLSEMAARMAVLGATPADRRSFAGAEHY
jgi:hypothetical protein